MSDKKERFTEIDVEKINIVDKSGQVKMTLFNQENIPPVLFDGKDILPGHRQSDPISGIMFYNGKGEETGGLIYGSEEDEKGNVTAGASLTFDQYNQDQVLQMHYSKNNDDQYYGFSIYDRPDEKLADIVKKDNQIRESDMDEESKKEELEKLYEGNVPRAFVGKSIEGDVAVKLMDSKGKQRIRMIVDENDIPKIEFLDEDGNVTYKLPPE